MKIKRTVSTLALVHVLVLLFAAPIAWSAEKSLTFQWQQDVMVTGDKWELHVSETAGGPYAHLADIPYVEAQSVYEQEITADIPPGGYYFVMKKVRGSDGAQSGWSNEVFYKVVNAPFELKLIFNSSQKEGG